MKKNKNLINWAAVIIWMIIIFLFSSQVGSQSDKNNFFIVRLFLKMGIDLKALVSFADVNFLIRKAAHMTEYFILMFLVFRAMRYKLPFSKAIVLSFVITVLYASTDEFHQGFVPGRAPRLADVIIDSCGALIYVIIKLVREFIHTKKCKV